MTDMTKVLAPAAFYNRVKSLWDTCDNIVGCGWESRNDIMDHDAALRALLREALERLHHAIGAVDTKYEENRDWITEIRRAVFWEPKEGE